MILIGIVLAALIVLGGGWLRMDVVGLLVLAALALTKLVTTQEALYGFSSPAVVTVWAMFILSAGLMRTGVAYRLGQPLQRFARRGEIKLMVALMVTASLISALVSTVTVAAILLPTTLDLSRRGGHPPSRLLLPLALGCLLGGPFISISNTTNILATDALRTAGLKAFDIFDFTPITAAVVAASIIFIALIGHRLLPDRPGEGEADAAATVGAAYKFDRFIFTLRIPAGSPLNGCTLAESRIGSALYLTVLGLQRKGVFTLAPRPIDILQSGDTLIVHGRPDHLQRFHASQHFQIESLGKTDELLLQCLRFAEGVIGEGSPLLGSTLMESGLRQKYHVHVLALHCPTEGEIKDLRRHRLEAGECLLLQGEQEALEKLARDGLISQLQFRTAENVEMFNTGQTQLLPVRVPPGSVLVDHDLVESRLGNAFGLTAVGLMHGEKRVCMPSPQEKVQAGDLLVLQGSARDLSVLEGLQELEIVEKTHSLMAELESQEIGATEVLLSPRTNLAGQTLRDLLFRERYGISVLSVWRKGKPYRSALQDMPLQFGDALLVYGQRRNLEALARDPDFLVLDKSAVQAPRLEKAPIAIAIMTAVLLSAILGFVPIAIAALAGSALMVLFGCLTMDEAYRAIEWKVVFLIAGMLPLGAAIENTGGGQMGAAALIGAVGNLSPRWVIAALFAVTVIAIQAIPATALVVLMAPIAISAAASLGISPHLLMMTVAMAASASFTGLLPHPALLLVMGPGGYNFKDYLKIGIPIIIVSMLVCVWLLPILWPPF